MSGPATSTEWISRVKPGDRVWAWWDTGAMGSDQMIRTVIRVNRKTLTIDSHGKPRRVPFEFFEGIWEGDE